MCFLGSFSYILISQLIRYTFLILGWISFCLPSPTNRSWKPSEILIHVKMIARHSCLIHFVGVTFFMGISHDCGGHLTHHYAQETKLR